MTSISTILSLVVVEYLHVEQLDVKTNFLHGYLEEEIYMQQPQGYEFKGKHNLVCILLHIILVTLVMSLQVIYLGSHKDFSPEKSDCCLLPKNTFLR